MVVVIFPIRFGHHPVVMAERVLMVCVANICRSPMAEALWNYHQAKLGLAPTASSAGISASFGDAIHPVTASLLAEQGIAVPSRGSRPLSTALLRESDLVLVMEGWHKSAIERMAPFARGKVYTLGHWQGFEVPDLVGESEAAFRAAFEPIDQGVSEWLRRLTIAGQLDSR